MEGPVPPHPGDPERAERALVIGPIETIRARAPPHERSHSDPISERADRRPLANVMAA